MCPKHPSQPVDECGYCERLIADLEFPVPDSDPSGEMADHEAAREADLMRRQWP